MFCHCLGAGLGHPGAGAQRSLMYFGLCWHVSCGDTLGVTHLNPQCFYPENATFIGNYILFTEMHWMD